MVILAGIVFGSSSRINQIQSSNVEKCNSFTGQLPQTLSQEDTAICHMAPSLLAAAQTGIAVSIILGILDIALVIIGAVKNPVVKLNEKM